MRYEVFSIFDLKSALYSQPFFVANQAVAVRSFSDLVSDPGSQLHKHPGDYELRGVGVWDDASGELISVNPVPILSAAAVMSIKGA